MDTTAGTGRFLLDALDVALRDAVMRCEPFFMGQKWWVNTEKWGFLPSKTMDLTWFKWLNLHKSGISYDFVSNRNGVADFDGGHAFFNQIGDWVDQNGHWNQTKEDFA